MSKVDVIHVCSFSDGVDYKVKLRGRVFYFDWSDRFGSLWLRADGTDTKRGMLPMYVQEWLDLWYRGGKLVKDGWCVLPDALLGKEGEEA